MSTGLPISSMGLPTVSPVGTGPPLQAQTTAQLMQGMTPAQQALFQQYMSQNQLLPNVGQNVSGAPVAPPTAPGQTPGQMTPGALTGQSAMMGQSAPLGAAQRTTQPAAQAPAAAAPAAAAQQGLSGTQQTDLQNAINSAFGNISGGGSAGSFDQRINQALQGSGQFTPAQLQAVQTGEQAAEPHGGGFYEQGSSAAPFEASWMANIQNALSNAPGGANTTAPVTSPVTSPGNTPASRAVPGTPTGQKTSAGGGGTPAAPGTTIPSISTALSQGANLLQPAYEATPPMLSPTMYGGTQVGPAAQMQAGNVGGTPMYSGAQLGPTSMYGGANIGPTAMSGVANVGSPQQTMNQLYTAFAPEAAQQEQNLNNQLAAFGISGGPAVQAQQQLSSALAAGLAPQLGQSLLSNQQLQANLTQGALGQNAAAQNAAQQAQAGLYQQAGMGNQAAQNAAAQYQAGLYQQAGMGNQSAQLSQQQLQANLQQAAASGNQSAINQLAQLQANLNQQTGQTNQAYANQASQTNLNDVIAQNLYNTGLYNQNQQTQYGTLEGDYNTLLQGYLGLNSAGLSGSQNIANTGLSGQSSLNYAGATNYPVQTGLGTAASGLGSALGSLYAKPSTPSIGLTGDQTNTLANAATG